MLISGSLLKKSAGLALEHTAAYAAEIVW
jgi:hypothetical protein